MTIHSRPVKTLRKLASKEGEDLVAIGYKQSCMESQYSFWQDRVVSTSFGKRREHRQRRLRSERKTSNVVRGLCVHENGLNTVLKLMSEYAVLHAKISGT